MQERRRPPEGGDIRGPRTGDFTDWDNPEDEDAPEGYYDEEDGDEGYIPGEDDPDYDLSEAAGYADWEPRRDATMPRWLIVVASVLLILAILTPVLLRLS